MMMIFFYSISICTHLQELSCYVCLLNEFNAHHIKFYFYSKFGNAAKYFFFFTFFLFITLPLLRLCWLFLFERLVFLTICCIPIHLMLLLILSCISFNEKKWFEMILIEIAVKALFRFTWTVSLDGNEDVRESTLFNIFFFFFLLSVYWIFFSGI